MEDVLMKYINPVLGAILAVSMVPAAATAATPSSAAKPPAPSAKEVARSLYKWSETIVHAVNIAKNNNAPPRFKVIHSYKGRYKKGQIIEPPSPHGYQPPPCSGKANPPRVAAGQSGVFAFSGKDELKSVSDSDLKNMAELNLIVASPKP
jgi:hypothetical protein